MVTRLLICLTAVMLAIVVQPIFSPGHFGATVEAAPPSCPPPRPGVICFQIDMTGSQQVPPVATGAWGFVRFYNFNDSKTAADYTVDVKGLSGTLIAGADLHRAPRGSNGPVIHHLADGGFIVTSGHMTFTPSDLNDISAGNWYVSLDTTEHPEGELRGQVELPDGFWTPTSVAPPAPSQAPFIPVAQQVVPLTQQGIPLGTYYPPVQAPPQPNFTASLYQPTAACYGDVSSVTFSWTPITYNFTQWLDLSFYDNNFADGTYYSYGPLLITDSTLTWDMFPVNTPFYWRVNSLTPVGWLASDTSTYSAC